MSQSGTLELEGRGAKSGGGLESLILNLICLALAAFFVGLVVWTIWTAGDFKNVFTIDNLFFITVCMLLALVSIFSPLLWLKDMVMSKRKPQSETATTAKTASASSRLPAPTSAAEATSLPKTTPASSKGKAAEARQFPPDVEKMLAQMKRSEPKS